MKKMTQEQFEKWAGYMYLEYLRSKYVASLCKDNKTIVVISKHGHRIGEATCHEDDTFNRPIGIAIAYARATGQEVPTVTSLVKISSLCYKDRFIYEGDSYIYVAKHPTLGKRIAVKERNGNVCSFLGFTLVEKI